jgi:hypothetical protein
MVVSIHRANVGETRPERQTQSAFWRAGLLQEDSLPARSTRPLYPLRDGAPGIPDEAGLEETSSDRGRELGGDVDDEDTAMNPRVARRPATPTKAMITAHKVHLADYRDWCAHCVAGRGVSHKHTT